MEICCAISFTNGSVTCKNVQVVPDLQASCNKSVHEADISGRVRTACSQLLDKIWNKLLASCNKVGNLIELVTSCPNKSDIACT